MRECRSCQAALMTKHFGNVAIRATHATIVGVAGDGAPAEHLKQVYALSDSARSCIVVNGQAHDWVEAQLTPFEEGVLVPTARPREHDWLDMRHVSLDRILPRTKVLGGVVRRTPGQPSLP